MKNSDLKNLSVVVMRNGDIYLKADYRLLNLKNKECWKDLDDDYRDDLTSYTDKNFDIIKVYNDIENIFNCWSDAVQKLVNNNEPTWERPKSILDDVEKEYLLQIIKPFRDRVVSICKKEYPPFNSHYIVIAVKFRKYYNIINLPEFKANTMYKGMKVKREYTLEELGI